MPREGYTNELAALLEGAVATARPIIQVLDVIAADVFTTRQEFQDADGGNSATDTDPPGFHVFEGGGCRLEGVQNILSEQLDVSGIGVPGNFDPSTTTLPIQACNINWNNVEGAGSILFEAVELDIQNGTGSNLAVFYHCQLFRCHSWERFGTPDSNRWTVEPITQVVTVAAAAGQSNPVFTFADDVIQIPIGAAPIQGENPADPLLPTAPTTIICWWATKANGDLQPGAVWRSFTDDQPPAPPDPRRFRFDFNPTGTTYQWDADTHFVANEGVPYYRLLGRTYASDTITWTTNPVDLGKVPDADSILSVSASIATPDDSIVITSINDGNGWQVFTDGQTIEELGMLRQQTYQVRANLFPATGAVQSSRCMRIGVSEIFSTIVDDQIEIESAEWVADPLSLSAEIPTMSMRIRRDGVLDYRSYAEDLISGTPFAQLTFRIWIGHPTLATEFWFHVDDFIMRFYDPGGDGIALALISPLLLMLDEIPQLAGPVRVPIDYVDATVEFVWRDLLDQVAIPARFIGGGPTDQNLVTNSIDAIRQVVDVRNEIDFIAGGVTVSSQGVWKWVSMFASGGVVATILRADYDLLGYDIGTDRRTPEVDIAYNGQTEEKQYVAADKVVDAFGRLGGGETLTITEAVSKWLPDATLPDIIGPRVVNNFGTGVSKMRVRCRTPRPFLEIGDLVTIEENRFVGYDPVGESPNRGNVFRTGRIVGIHDIFCRELTVWVQPFTTGTTVVSEPAVNALGTSRTTIVAYAGEDFRAARWPQDLANTVGMGTIQTVRGIWEWWGGAVRVESTGVNGDFRAVLPLPLIEGTFILNSGMVAEIPVGTLTAELVEYPADGSPRIVLATYSFTDTVGRVTDETAVPQPGINVEGDATYTVEVTCADLDDGDWFAIYAYALEIREVL